MIYGELVKEQQMKDKDEIIAQINLNDYSDDNIVEEETIVNKLDVGVNVTVFINSNDGERLPHFHIKTYKGDNTKDTDIDFCICIYRANYFLHNSHTKRLNNQGMRRLINALNYKNDDITLWQKISNAWLKRFGNKYNEKLFKMPNYYPNMPDVSEEKQGEFNYDN